MGEQNGTRDPRPQRKPRNPKQTPRGAAIRRLRQELDWTEEQLGKPHGLSKKVVHNLENGWRTEPTRREAEEYIAPLGLPPVALDVSDAFGRWVQAAASPAEPVSPEEEDARRAVVIAGLLGHHVAQVVLPVLQRRALQERFERDRRQADERCEYLRRLKTDEARRERIRDAEDYQTWAMVERLAHESERAAADKPALAREWAELALSTVPFVRGPESRRQRLEGYATFFRANALRVGNGLDGAAADFERAWHLWRAGEGDELPLDEGCPLDLEASLRREQRRFEEALDLHRRALAVSPAPGRILLNKAATLEQMGDVEASVEALEAARPHIERSGSRRDIFGLMFNVALNKWHLGKFEAAKDLIPGVRASALALGNELDLTRVLWIEARLDSSLGLSARAAASLKQVFEDLISHTPPLPYDAALTGMDLAVLHLEHGHSREVMALALRMEKVFVSLGIEREALSALLVFCEAARREEATVELARRTAEVIEKVRRARRPSRPEAGRERGEGG
jgi:tetratricopeptide (TPR) repeat protein/DNA-binding XRE family transcriptional regulator